MGDRISITDEGPHSHEDSSQQDLLRLDVLRREFMGGRFRPAQ